ncbi:hypothetical protein COV20_01205 [Candidatus Woesearchaeota archaeon CG10_big_fil_rev_8_21_14_0_10_45_16]|nr:MAG: hypothetical protein COV20_01205 [Candidatus Woesearchaeota archaeon CG10_big_fil_rev_8_21_14_0_10_45_16]
MRWIAILICLLILTTPALAANSLADAQEQLQTLKGLEFPAPLSSVFKNERMNIEVTMQDGKVETVGITITDGTIKTVSMESLENPTIIVTMKEMVFFKVIHSAEPLQALKEAIDKGEIRYSAVGFIKKIKMGTFSFIGTIMKFFSDANEQKEDLIEPEIIEEELAEIPLDVPDPVFAASVVTLESCGDPEGGWQENHRYELSADINVEGVYSCFQPTASNIVFDGNGYSLRGQGETAIRIEDLNNVRLHSLDLVGFETGIYLADSVNVSVQQIHLRNIQYGLRSDRSDEVKVINVDALSDGNRAGIGLFFTFGSNNQINQNTFSNLASAIQLQGEEESSVTGNRISGSYRGIVNTDGIQNTISQNTIQDPSIAGIILRRGESNTIFRNIIQGSSGQVNAEPLAAISLDESNANTIQENTIQETFLDGIHLLGSSQNIIRANTLLGNEGKTAIFLIASAGNNILENEITRNGVGIAALSSSPTFNVRISDNTICNNRIKDLVCSGFQQIDGAGNTFRSQEGCPVSSWPVLGTHYQPCN